jgi:hypothetical protein
MTTARALADQLPLKLGVLTKAERGFYVAQGKLGQVYKAGKVAIAKDMSVAESFASIVHSCLKHFRLNEPLLLEKTGAVGPASMPGRDAAPEVGLFAVRPLCRGQCNARDSGRTAVVCFGFWRSTKP